MSKESLDQIEPSFWEPLNGDMTDWLDVRPPCRVLDAGCGRGDHVALFAEALHPGGSVTALDIDPEALQQTRTRMSGRKEAECVRYQVVVAASEDSGSLLGALGTILMCSWAPAEGADGVRITGKPASTPATGHFCAGR